MSFSNRNQSSDSSASEGVSDRTSYDYKVVPTLHHKVDVSDLSETGLLQPHRVKATVSIGQSHYGLYKTLGSGNFGEVWLAQDNATGKWVAVKKIMDAESHQAIRDEAKKIQKTMPARTSGDGTGHANLKGRFISMGLLQGQELFEFMQFGSAALTTDDFLQIAIQMCDQVDRYNVEQKILLVDIKPENAILDFGRRIKLSMTDFGLALDAGEGEDLRVTLDHAQGSDFTLAPEILAYYQYSRKSESYAVGVSLLDLVRHRATFKFRQKEMSYSARNTASELMVGDEDVLQSFVAICKGLTSFDPFARLYLDEARDYFKELRKQYLSHRQVDVKVAVLDLNEFAELSATDKQTLIHDLGAYGSLQLIDSSGHDRPFIELLGLKQAILKIAHEEKVALKIFDTIPVGENKDKLVAKACRRTVLESRRGLYRYDFYLASHGKVEKIQRARLGSSSGGLFVPKPQLPQSMDALISYIDNSYDDFSKNFTKIDWPNVLKQRDDVLEVWEYVKPAQQVELLYQLSPILSPKDLMALIRSVGVRAEHQEEVGFKAVLSVLHGEKDATLAPPELKGVVLLSRLTRNFTDKQKFDILRDLAVVNNPASSIFSSRKSADKPFKELLADVARDPAHKKANDFYMAIDRYSAWLKDSPKKRA